ncbi:predicted protein [Histoplasma capsulatum var. duboisii H88]|uniref:Predicted protein n=1 Tax=Ajellomyces capsulatus (strain H88) TaxID=544711 RepID=F0UHW1_AJEC8|nr:predicted protein [Histoplasma capsulatum var. duboisii H88]
MTNTVQFRFPTTTPQFGPIYGVRSISNFVRCRATGLPLSLRLLRLFRLLRLASTCFTLERFLCPPAACIHTGTDYVHAHYHICSLLKFLARLIENFRKESSSPPYIESQPIAAPKPPLP